MRNLQFLTNPVAVPGVCGKCGSEKKDWFVDIGIDVEFNAKKNPEDFSMWLDGVFYLCCDCLNNVIKDAHRQYAQYLKNHDVEVALYGYTDRSDDPVSNGTREEPDGNDSGTNETIEEPTSLSLGFGSG